MGAVGLLATGEGGSALVCLPSTRDNTAVNTATRGNQVVKVALLLAVFVLGGHVQFAPLGSLSLFVSQAADFRAR